MAQHPSPARYLSYLLRLWQTSDGGRPVWRVSLESPVSRKCYGFATLHQLMVFLAQATGESIDDEEMKNESSK